MSDLKNLAEQYFAAFSRKDIIALAEMFEHDVILRDWEIFAAGKDAVVDANQSIFDGVDTIQVTPMDIYQEGDVIIADLKILVNGSEELKVVDILHFDRHGKITKIKAYKG